MTVLPEQCEFKLQVHHLPYSRRPDVVQIFGNPHQIISPIYANMWDGSDNVTLSTNGHGACCYEVMVVPYLTNE